MNIVAPGTSETIRELVKDIALNQGFTEYDFDIADVSLKGIGYMGVMKRLHVYETSRPNRALLLMIKSAPTSKKLRETTPVKKLYDREIYMYKTVFPEFEKIQQERRVKDKFSHYAKSFGVSNTELEECLILDDLDEGGYTMWDRMEPMNADHIAIVVQAYARFHACSLLLKTFNPELFKELEKNLQDVLNEEAIIKSQVTGATSNGYKAVEGDERATTALDKYFSELKEVLKELNTSNKYSVVSHSDCWTNNMMFQYRDPNDGGKPTKVCLLDWQIAKISSPVLDLAYFLPVCSSKQVLYDYKTYLDLYYKTLSNLLRQANCDPNEVFPREEFDDQWKKLAKVGVFISTLAIKAMVSKEDESVDFGQAAESGKDLFTAIADAQSNLNLYYERVAIVINFMIDEGLI